MTLDQITAIYPQISKMILEKYPKTKAERRGCQREKQRMDGLRLLLAKRLMVDEKEKSEQTGTDTAI